MAIAAEREGDGDEILADPTCKSTVNESTGSPKTKKKFTPDEDRYLLYLVSMLGMYDWKSVSGYMKGRSRRQCRERFKYYLEPGLYRPAWTPYEDELLVQKVQEFGPKWANISQFFPGRTDIDLKNRYQIVKRSLADMESEAELEAGGDPGNGKKFESMVMREDLLPPVHFRLPVAVERPRMPRKILAASLRPGQVIVSAHERS
jgi:hypothetical protein